MKVFIFLFGFAGVKSIDAGGSSLIDSEACSDAGDAVGESDDAAGLSSISAVSVSNAPGPSSSAHRGADCATPIFDPESYVIPTSNFPRYLVSSLHECNDKKLRLPLHMRRLLVRIISSDIHLVNERPGRPLLRVIVRKLVCNYPCLRETLENGDSIGSGFGGLLYCFEHRFDNLNRRSANTTAKIVTTTPKKICQRDAYGCINYAPKLSFSAQTLQRAIASSLKEEFDSDGIVSAASRQKMKEIYGYQRYSILLGKCVADLEGELPLLFTLECYTDHVEMLMGISSTSTLTNTGKRVPNVLQFIQRKQPNIIRESVNLSIDCLFFLASYFKEDAHLLFVSVGVSMMAKFRKKNSITIVFV